MSGDRVGQLTEPPHPMHCSQKVWFGCCLTMTKKWGVSPSCMNLMCFRWWSDACSKNTCKSFPTTQWHTAPVTWLGKATRSKSWSTKILHKVRAVVQAVGRRLPTAAARVQARVRSCGICGGQSGTETGFLRVLRFPLPILIPPSAPHSSSTIQGWYNKPNIGWRTKWTQSHPTSRN
jgi:hypothetical protein